jgi:hypothetical protein
MMTSVRTRGDSGEPGKTRCEYWSGSDTIPLFMFGTLTILCVHTLLC